MLQMNYEMNALLISVISRSSDVEFQAGKLSEHVSGVNDLVARQLSTAEHIEKLTKGIANARPGNNNSGGKPASEHEAIQQLKIIPGDLLDDPLGDPLSLYKDNPRGSLGRPPGRPVVSL